MLVAGELVTFIPIVILDVGAFFTKRPVVKARKKAWKREAKKKYKKPTEDITLIED